MVKRGALAFASVLAMDNGKGTSMWYRLMQPRELNHYKLSACVSFSSTVTNAAFDKSFWVLLGSVSPLQLPFCLSAIAVVKMEVARLVSHLAFLRVY